MDCKMLWIVNLMSKSYGLLVQEWKEHFSQAQCFFFYPLGMKILILKIFYFQHLQNGDAYTVLDNNVAI